MRPWLRNQRGGDARGGANQKIEQAVPPDTTIAAFYSHVESMISAFREWPGLLQGSLHLHPRPSPNYGLGVENAVTDLRAAVEEFCSALNSFDDKFAAGSAGLGEDVTSSSKMPMVSAQSTICAKPSLKPQNTVRLCDVASTHDAERWNRVHNNADSAVDIATELNGSESLDTSDGRWRETCPSGVLNPRAPCRKWWDRFVVILVVVDTLIVPFQLAYLPHPAQSLLMLMWPWFLTLFFAVDMFLSFRTGFCAGSKDGERPGMLVTDRAKIAQRYMQSWAFLLDAVATFPCSQILLGIAAAPLFEPWKEQLVLITKLIRLVRLLRLAKLVDVWERVEESLGSVTQLHAAALVRILVTIFFFCHFNACIWWMVGQRRHPLAAFMSKEANEQYEALPHWTTVERSGGPDFPSWKWAKEPVFTAYVFCCYWTLGVMRTMPSEVLPANIQERVYVMVFMFLALSLFAVSIAQVTQTFTKFTERQRTFKEELLALRLHMNTIGAPDSLQEDVVSYSKHLFHRRLVNAKESGLMSRLPVSLSQDLHYARVESYLRRLPTFAEWPQRSLRQVSAISEVKHTVRGTVLSQRNHEAIGVWVLMSGHLEVFRPSPLFRRCDPSLASFQDSQKNPRVAHELRHPSPLEVVDEICLTSKEIMQSAVTVIASCCCEVLFIPKDCYFALLAQQPFLGRLNSARAELLVSVGSESDQPLLSWSLHDFRSSMNRASAGWWSYGRSSLAPSTNSRNIMLATEEGGSIFTL